MSSPSSIHRTTLANGVRVLVEPLYHVQSTAIGLWCTTGSRHEHDSEAGITHFIEHMLFKGTTRRTAKQIAESIEGRGGVLNAFTDKEQTCYYARVLADDVPNAIDVLTDMVTHSQLDGEELAREKGVVLEEIRQREDDPGDFVHEVFLNDRWGQHPLGKPIIGTSESVSSFERDDLVAYMDRRYTGGNLILSIAGHVDPDAVVELAEHYLGNVKPGAERPPLTKPIGHPVIKEMPKDVEQVHFAIGTDSCGVTDPAVHRTAVLDGVLGSGMSSRLFQEVREKRGLAYSIGTYTLPYSAGGAFVVYGGTSASTWTQVQEVVRFELNRLITEGLEDGELERIKRQMKGNMVLALEGMNSRMMRMSRNEIHHGREIPVEETLAKIDAVTKVDVSSLAKEMFADDRMSTAAIGPFGA